MAEVQMPIRAFRGLNIREPAPVIDDHELSKCVNFDLGRNGELKRRTGFEQLQTGAALGSNQVKVIGHYYTATYSQVFAVAGSDLWYSADGVYWIRIGTPGQYNDVEWGCQYSDKFYFVRRTAPGLLEWNGVAITVIAGTPAGTFNIMHKDRMFIINTQGAANVASTVYFSLAGPAGVNTEAGWVSTNNFLFQAGDGDWLTVLSIVNDVLVCFKGSTTWGLYVQGTSPDHWIIRNLSPRIGCVSKYTPRDVEGAVYFVSSRGIYKTDGTAFVDISEPISPVLEGRILSLNNINVDSAAWWEDKYIVMLQPDPTTVTYYVYHIRADGWTEWQISGGVQPYTFLEVRTPTPSRGLYAGDRTATGKTFRFGVNVYTDIGAAYNSVLETKEYDFDALTNYKRGKWMALDTIGAGTLTLTHIVDSIERTAISVTSQVDRKALKAVGPGYFRAWKLRLSMSGSSFDFYGMALFIHRKRTLVKAAT